MSVSLLAVAALAAGVFLNRTRQPTTQVEIHTDDGVDDAVQLEALRRAGI